MLSQDAKQFAVKAKDLYHQVGRPGTGGETRMLLVSVFTSRRGAAKPRLRPIVCMLRCSQGGSALRPTPSPTQLCCPAPAPAQALFRKYLPLIILVAVVLLFIVVRFVF